MIPKIKYQKPDIQDINIPDWMGTQLDPENLELLRKGKKTKPLELIDPAGKRQYGVLQAITKENETDIRLHKKNMKKDVDYPMEIDGEVLDKDQLKLLKSGKFVALKNGNFLKVDPKLNRVMIYTGKELEMVSQIGNYKLSPIDKQRLLNEQSLTRILQDKNGNHVLTKINFDKDQKSFVVDMEQTKVITQQEAEKYLVNQKVEDLNITNADPEKTMRQFLEGNDHAMVQLKEMQAAGYTPQMETLLNVTNNQESSRAHQLINSFDMDSKEFEKLTTIYYENQARSIQTGERLTITDIDIKNQKIIALDDQGKPKEMDFKSTRTEAEHQIYIQSQGKSRSKDKGISLNN